MPLPHYTLCRTRAVQATNRIVIFGGERDAGVLDDLWTLKGADGSEPAKWTQIKLRPAPAARFGHAIAGGVLRVWAWVRHLCTWLWSIIRGRLAARR